MGLLEVGDEAPEVRAKDADGNDVSLSGLKGRWVLVYFYPKDDTPGCTAEACSLNDSLGELSECGADVIGVSTQGDASHTKFRNKYGLKFALAADTDGAVTDAYGASRGLGPLALAARVSYLVGPDGKIAYVWPHVSPGKHAEEVLETVKRLSRERAGAAN
jgi:thioredoxin-dependent peroxiredoxin